MKYLFFVILLFPTIGYTSDLTASEVMKKSHIAMYYPADNGIADVQMIVKSDDGNVKEKSFIFYRKDINDGGKQLFLLRFTSPATIKNVALLVDKNPSGSDKRWLYMPSFNKIRRVGVSQTRSSFMDSDYYYEDISGRNLTLDSHQFISQDDEYYFVKSFPKVEDIDLDYYISKIDKKTFLPVDIKYYGGGVVEREFKAISVIDVSGFPTIVSSQIHDFVQKSTTQVQFNNLRYNVKLPKNVFKKRFLRRLN